MNTPDVDTIRARANAASPAPWTARSYDGGYRVADASGNDITGNIDYEVGGVPNEADAEFIAHARTDVPALLAEVERLTGELAKVDRLAQSGIRAEASCRTAAWWNARAQAVRQVEAERDADLSLAEQRDAELAELRRTSQQSIDARDRLLHEATAERDRYRDLAERTEQEHRRLEAERADAIRDFVHANDRAGELETELELMRHSRDRYQAVVERVRAYLSLLESEAADEQDGDDWSIGTYHAYGRVRRELADALSAAETPREVDVVIRDGQPRVWPAIPEPGPEVTAVRDCDGDVWLREDDHWRIRHGNRFTGAWSDVAAYAPLTDASEATPADPAVVAPLCSRCSSNPVAKPGERNADGMPGTPSLRARFCAECIDRCHESTDFAHECAICADPTERGEVTP